jgi:flavin-dependent dehydrogenase
VIRIGGLGVAGSYLLKRLTSDGFEVEGFDPKRDDYYLPCGYATNEHLLKAYLDRIGLDADSYIVSRAESIHISGHGFDGISFPSSGMCTINKNALEKDMVRGLNYRKDTIADIQKGTIIDASGVSRAYLGPAEGDFTMYAKEYLSEKSEHKDFYFYFFQGGRGYFWEFPMDGKYHVGAGADSLDLIESSLKSYPHERIVGRKLRLKPLFDKIFDRNVIGVGEAIGTVSPISGEGIIPSLKSAEILFEMIRRYGDSLKAREEYAARIRKAFGTYPRLHALVRNIQDNRALRGGSLRAALDAGQDLRNFGIDFKIRKVIGHFL